MAKSEDLQEYYDKSLWIRDALELLQIKGLLGSGMELNNFERIHSTNQNNYYLLEDYRWKPEELGKLTFWACKKTVDMNLKTMKSALNRNDFDPELLRDYLSAART